MPTAVPGRHVLFKLLWPDKALSAALDGTQEVLMGSMGLHVVVQILLKREPLVTQVALVRLVGSVNRGNMPSEREVAPVDLAASLASKVIINHVILAHVGAFQRD